MACINGCRSKTTAGCCWAIDSRERRTIGEAAEFPDIRSDNGRRIAILVNGTFNHHLDIQACLTGLLPKLARTSRLLVVLYNPYLRWLYSLANRLGIRSGELPDAFITQTDLGNLAKISGFEMVQRRHVGYSPWRLLGLGSLCNRVLPLVPGLRWLGLTYIAVLRPLIASPPMGLTCVIPARNERGNIENALRRFPELGCPVEIIFVEGHSTDGTWEEIERAAPLYRDRFAIQAWRQTGKGKGDAVRLDSPTPRSRC